MARSLEQNLLAWLPFDEDLLDHSTNKLQVTTHGTVLLSSGAKFDGASWLELPNIPLARRPFTVALWLLASEEKYAYALVTQPGPKLPGQYLHLHTRYGLRPYLGFHGNDLQPLPQYTFKLHTWVHLAFQYHGGRQRIYMNGKLIAERACAEYIGELRATLIGRGEEEWKCDNFSGWMKDLRIYNGALNDAQIEALARPVPPLPVLPPQKRKQKEF